MGIFLAGLVVALALIPEAIAFSIIAGVDPKVGLYASFCICVIMAFIGGRPGQISAATGAMALLMVTLVRDLWTRVFASRYDFNWGNSAYFWPVKNWVA